MDILLFIFLLIIFPHFLSKLVYSLQEKCKNINIVVFINVFSFIFFAVYGFVLLYINSIVVAAMSSDSTINYMWVVYFRNIIGLLFGIIYSIIINFKQVSRHIDKLKVSISEENIFVFCLMFEVVLIFCFEKLCHIW